MQERTKCLETEYGNLTTETGEHINGVQVMMMMIMMMMVMMMLIVMMMMLMLIMLIW